MLNGDGTTFTDLTSQVSMASPRASRAPCLAVKRKEAVETDTSQTNHYGSFLPLAFTLRRFVVDADTQFIAIFHLQHNPGFSHSSAEIFIS
jgi:hypothetical protein